MSGYYTGASFSADTKNSYDLKVRSYKDEEASTGAQMELVLQKANSRLVKAEALDKLAAEYEELVNRLQELRKLV